MKNFKFVLAALLLALASCSDDAAPETSNYTSAFENDFPNATNVTWTKDGDYYVASFSGDDVTARSSSSTKQAWYDEDGNNYLEEDFITESELPTEIINSFKNKILEYNPTATISGIKGTKGRFKKSLFYKIYGDVTVGSFESYPTLEMYYDNSGDYIKIDFWEDKDLAMTIMPDLYAMKYIEANYEDYCIGLTNDYYSGSDAIDYYSANEAYVVYLYIVGSEMASEDFPKNQYELVFKNCSSSDVELLDYFD